MKIFLKRFFILLTCALLIFCFIYRHMLNYLLSQGRGQWQIMTEAISCEEAMERYASDSLMIRKLKLLMDVKEFAAAELQLNTHNTFQKIYFPKKDTMQLRVINACDPLSFTAYTWKYPIIGDAPYQGFFDTQRLQQEYSKLKSQNLDVDVGQVEAWSTLGIISNPLMFSVLENSNEEICETIIHECLHATLFLASESEFNESFAQFIGEKGAELYFEKHSKSHATEKQKQRKAKQELLKQILWKHAQQLEQVYASNYSIEEKVRRKKQVIRACCETLFQQKLFGIQRTKRFAVRLMKSGNALFSAYRTYHSKRFDFEKELCNKYQNNVSKMIDAYKKSYSNE